MYKIAIGITFGVLLFSNTAMATCSSYPYTLTNGATADATQVMADFNCAALTSGATLNAMAFTGANTMQSPGTSSDPLVIKNHSGVVGIEMREDATSYLKQYFYDHTGTTANIFLAGEGTSYLLNDVGVGLSAKASGQALDQALSVYGNIYFTNSSSNATAKSWNILGAPYYSVYPGGDHDISYLSGSTGGSAYASLSLGGGISGNVAVNGIYFFTGSSYNTDTGTLRMVINGSGNIGIGTSSPSYTLHVNGSVAGTSAYNNLSDARLKKNIVPLVGGLALISRLQPVRFDWRSESEREVGKGFNLPAGKQIGFVAQDVAKVLPEAATTAKGNDAIMSVAESKIVPVLVTAVKELKAANDNQSAEIGRLEGQVVALQRKVNMQTAQR